MSKKTVVAVAEYLRQQTGDPNLAPRPVLRSLVESGRIGAVSGKGWYEFNGDYASIVRNRDKQLQELHILAAAARSGFESRGKEGCVCRALTFAKAAGPA